MSDNSIHRPYRPSGSSRPAHAGELDQHSSSSMIGNVGTMNMVEPQNTMNVPTATTGGIAVSISVAPDHRIATPPAEMVLPGLPREDHEIYYYQLLSKKRGSPLWCPGPGEHLSLEYRRQGIDIGDVGIIKQGEFDFLFNIFQPANSTVNSRGVPESFSPLNLEGLEIGRSRLYGPNSYLTSSSVRTLSINSSHLRFESSAPEAAILTMPEGASTRDLLNENVIQSCILQNARSWYNYATGPRGRLLERGEVLGVVTGWDKVCSWGIATSTCTRGESVALEFKADGEPGAWRAYHWDCTGCARVRIGPQEEEISDLQENGASPRNQSVFIRTMNFTIAGTILKDHSQTTGQDIPVSRGGKDSTATHQKGGLKGQWNLLKSWFFGRQSSSVQRGSDTHQDVTIDSRESGIVHPSSLLHELLLEKYPNATMAVTKDADWMSVLSDEDDGLPEPEKLLNRILKSYEVHENDGILTLQKKPPTAYKNPDTPIPLANHCARKRPLHTNVFLFAPVLLLLLFIDLCVRLIIYIPCILLREEASSNIVDDRCQRPLSSIVWACLSTILICAWTSVHPYVLPQGRPNRTLWRLILMFWVIVAPELFLSFSIKQHLAAMTIRDTFNEKKGYKQESHGIWKTLKGKLFGTKDATSSAWTLRHGYFLLMGGFRLVEPSVGIHNSRCLNFRITEQGIVLIPSFGMESVLTSEVLEELLKDREFNIQVTEDQMKRSAWGDRLYQKIVIFQFSWFIMQCLARSFQGLSLSQLELVTMSFASLNAITLILWWNKPLAVQAPVHLYLKRELTNAERTASERGHLAQFKLIPHVQQIFTKAWTSIHDIVMRQSRFFNGLMRFPSTILLLLSPIIAFIAITFSFIYTIISLLETPSSFPAGARTPKRHDGNGIHVFILLMSSFFILGAISYAGWNLPFPTHAEQKLWRMASLAVTIMPVGMSLFHLIFIKNPCFTFGVVKKLVEIALIISMFASVSARFVLLGRALASLGYLPQAAFVAVDWTKFFSNFYS